MYNVNVDFLKRDLGFHPKSFLRMNYRDLKLYYHQDHFKYQSISFTRWG